MNNYYVTYNVSDRHIYTSFTGYITAARKAFKRVRVQFTRVLKRNKGCGRESASNREGVGKKSRIEKTRLTKNVQTTSAVNKQIDSGG